MTINGIEDEIRALEYGKNQFKTIKSFLFRFKFNYSQPIETEKKNRWLLHKGNDYFILITLQERKRKGITLFTSLFISF